MAEDSAGGEAPPPPLPPPPLFSLSVTLSAVPTLVETGGPPRASIALDSRRRRPRTTLANSKTSATLPSVASAARLLALYLALARGLAAKYPDNHKLRSPPDPGPSGPYTLATRLFVVLACRTRSPPALAQSMTARPMRLDSMWSFFYVVLTLIAARGVWTIRQRPWLKRAVDDDDQTPRSMLAHEDDLAVAAASATMTVPARLPGVRAPSTLPKFNHSAAKETKVAAVVSKSFETNSVPVQTLNLGGTYETDSDAAKAPSPTPEIPVIPVTDGDFLGGLAKVLPLHPCHHIEENVYSTSPDDAAAASNLALECLPPLPQASSDKSKLLPSGINPKALSEDKSFGDEFWKAVSPGVDNSSTEGARLPAGAPDVPPRRVQSNSSFMTDSSSGGPVEEAPSPPSVIASAQAALPLSQPPPPLVRPPKSRKQSHRPLPPKPDSPTVVHSVPNDRRTTYHAGADNVAVTQAVTATRRVSGRYGKDLPSPPAEISPGASDNDSGSERPAQVALRAPHLPTALDLKGRKLTTLPIMSVDHCRVLTRLSLRANKLAVLPATVVESMPNLVSLDISDNLLRTVPRGLGALHQLRELSLAGNGIERLEAELGECVSVEMVSLARNRLYEIVPAAITTLGKLRHLDLSHNFLRTLPPCLAATASTLKTLLIDENPIEPSMLKIVQPLLTAGAGVLNNNSRWPSSLRGQNSTGNLKSMLAGMGRTRREDSAVFDFSADSDASFATTEEEGRSMASFDSGIADVERSRVLAKREDDEATAARGGAMKSIAYQVHLARLLNHLQDVGDLHAVGPGSRAGSSEDLRRLAGAASADSEQRTSPAFAEPMHKVTEQAPQGAPSPPPPPQPPSPPSPPPSERRRKIAEEIVATERTYVRELDALADIYVRPLREEGVFGDREMELVFANVLTLLKFHKETLLPDFEAKLADPAQPLGASFRAMASSLVAYEAYYNNFDAASGYIALLESIGATSSSSSSSSYSSRPTRQMRALKPLAKRFRAFALRAKRNPRHASQISLQSFLILPVQRLPRYKLLIDTLLKSTAVTDADRGNCEAAAQEVAAAVMQCNERKRDFEAGVAGAGVLARIRGDFLHELEDTRLRFSADLRVLKYVERDWTGALDLTGFMERVTKKKGRKRCEVDRVGRLREWRVGKLYDPARLDNDDEVGRRGGGVTGGEDGNGSDGAGRPRVTPRLFAEHGVRSVRGVTCAFHLVGGRLLWCGTPPAAATVGQQQTGSISSASALSVADKRMSSFVPAVSAATSIVGLKSPDSAGASSASTTPTIMMNAPASDQVELVRTLAGDLTVDIVGGGGGGSAGVDVLARLCDGTCVLYVLGAERVVGSLAAAARTSGAAS
ncbi:hypothetical protein HDU87_003147 [Geranomyces variabilis]|uniref:DH domain-containing protein n=1 Tax=Geranomyces variabilis TaxID=109894 RepID=A0AAD5TKP2_9FUNG|nr:hypothetical protein HDU87_003147 [Geranomyces variabilis]